MCVYLVLLRLRSFSEALECPQGPQKAITSGLKTPSTASTFIVGTADGRVLSFSDEYEYVGGDAHASLVAGLSAGPSGTVHSVGFDDRLREIDGKDYT